MSGRLNLPNTNRIAVFNAGFNFRTGLENVREYIAEATGAFSLTNAQQKLVIPL